MEHLMSFPFWYLNIIICIGITQTSCSKGFQTSSLTDGYSLCRQDTKSAEIDDYWVEDPFMLSNVQWVYDSICYERSTSSSGFFERGKQLSATHRILRISPHDAEEQRRLEFDTRLKVDYLPFKKRRSTNQDELLVAGSVPNRYEIEGEFASCIKQPEISVHSAPNDIYVVWPKDIVVPDTLNYVILYEAYLPEQIGLKERRMSEDEILLFNKVTGNSSRRYYYGQYGSISFYDEFLASTVTTYKLNLRIQLGSAIQDIQAVNGTFQLPGWYPIDATIGYYLQQEKFTVCSGDITGLSPHVTVLGTIAELWDTSSPYSFHSFTISPDNPTRIYRAGDYFFKRVMEQAPYFPVLSHINIYSMPMPNSSSGVFNGNAVPNISMYTNGYESNDFIGSVMHELGHSVQHAITNNNIGDVNDLLCESFASFMGWYYGELYYTSKGYVKPNPWSHINWQHRQSWTGATPRFYSPIFVDLKDSFNQNSYNPSYLYDSINDRITLQMVKMLGACLTFSDFMSDLGALVNFSDTELSYFNVYYSWMTTYGYE